MPEISYICLSDLHLGADTSLLTNLRDDAAVVAPLEPSPVLVELASWLRSAIRITNKSQKPTLVLNGDLLELALALDNRAVMAFERLLELLFLVDGESLFNDEIIFIPGNHDHHLWETVREKQYADFLQKNPPGKLLPPPFHTTRMVNPPLIENGLLNAVIARYPRLKDRLKVRTVYPNYAIFSSNGTKCVVFTHGHYVESIYRLMTELGNLLFPNRRVPEYIWQIEGENFAWIDFFWSAMGRSGDVGDYIERVYDSLLVPKFRNKLASRLAQIAGHKWKDNIAGDLLGEFVSPFIAFLLNRAYGVEKANTGQALSTETATGLKLYAEGPLRAELELELGDRMPEEITLLFGHTHKPFSCQQDFEGLASPVHVYNSGGWVVDTEDVEPLHGGAVLLVDSELNTVSVRMYNEASHLSQYKVAIEAAKPSIFFDLMRNAVAQVRPQSESFSKTVAASIDRYHANFRKRLATAL